MLSTSELKSTLAKHNIRPNKYLGQNFMVDENVCEAIVSKCGFSNADWVLEIGAGLGALTMPIAALVERVIAVEKDRRIYFILRELLKGFNNINFMCEDFLEMNLSRLFLEGPDKIKAIGNLPYYITTPIIEKLIDNRDHFESIFITVQKEVGERICAAPGNKDYSSLSCFVQYYMKPSVLLTIGKRAFYPQPKVDSVFIKLSILAQPAVQVNDADRLFAIIRAAFRHRRKTLLNSLFSSDIARTDKNDLSVLLKSINIDPTIRAENLSLQDFAKIANVL